MGHSIIWFWTTGIHDPAWVQAFAAIALVVLTLVTLIYLRAYVRDTRILAKTSVEQVQNAQTPFLALIRVTQKNDTRSAVLNSLLPFTYEAWAVQNQGNAPAINIKVSGETHSSANEKEFFDHLAPLAVGESAALKIHPAANVTGCLFEYGSLDGRRFSTAISRENDSSR